MGLHRSLANLLLLTVAGCSLGITGPDPGRPRNEVPTCDTGKGPVAMDATWATLFGIGALTAFSDDESGVGLALGAASALFVASAIRGNNSANACRGSFDEYNLAVTNMRRPPVVAEAQPRPVPKKPKKPRPVPVQIEPEETLPVEPEPPITPEYASPRPIVKPVATPPEPKDAKQPKPAPKAPPAKSKPEPEAEDWSWFWKELP